MCVKWFNAMATAEEKIILKPPLPAAAGEPAPKVNTGQRRTISRMLNTLLVERLIEAYETASANVPRDFFKENYLLPATLRVCSSRRGVCRIPRLSQPGARSMRLVRGFNHQRRSPRNEAGGLCPQSRPPRTCGL